MLSARSQQLRQGIAPARRSQLQRREVAKGGERLAGHRRHLGAAQGYQCGQLWLQSAADDVIQLGSKGHLCWLAGSLSHRLQ